MERWNRAQRVVVVVAYGLALQALWGFLQMSPWDSDGWFNYAPNSGVIYGGPAMMSDADIRLAVQLVLVLVWAAPSWWLLRDVMPGSERSHDDADGGAIDDDTADDADGDPPVRSD